MSDRERDELLEVGRRIAVALEGILAQLRRDEMRRAAHGLAEVVDDSKPATERRVLKIVGRKGRN